MDLNVLSKIESQPSDTHLPYRQGAHVSIRPKVPITPSHDQSHEAIYETLSVTPYQDQYSVTFVLSKAKQRQEPYGYACYYSF